MRNYKLFKLLVLVCLLAPIDAASQEIAESVTYTFNSADWGCDDNDINNSNWVSKKNAMFSVASSCLQLSKDGIACANSPVSFSNINKVIVNYRTNAKTGAGEININCVDTSNAAINSGTPLVTSKNVNTTGGATYRDMIFTPTAYGTSGYIQIYAKCTENSIYIKSITIIYDPIIPLPQLSFEKDVFRKIVKTGEVFQIKALSPFLNNEVCYNSTNPDVAIVDEEGKVRTLKAGNTIISASVNETEYYSGQRIAYALTVIDPNCDLLTASLFSATGSGYQSFSNVKKDGDNGINSNAVYAGNTAKDVYGAIQIRKSNSNSGIVTTSSGGFVKRIEIEWSEKDSSGDKIQIYGNELKAYSNATDLYKNSSKGDSLGVFTCGKSTALDISNNYQYVGICAYTDKTLYINSIKIFWDTIPWISLATGTYTSPQDVTITSEQDTYIIYTTDGTSPTLTNGIKTDGNSFTITISANCTLKAVAADDSGALTPVASEKYRFVTITGDGSFENPYSPEDVKTLYNEKLYNAKRYVWVRGAISEDMALGDVCVSPTGNEYLYDVIGSNKGKEIVICGKIDENAVALTSIIKINGLCDIPITTKEGYGTYCNYYTYEMPEGVVGYIITDADKTSNRLTLEKAYTSKDIVPYGTSLLLKGEHKTYSANVINTSRTRPANNLLHGWDDVDANGITWIDGTDVKYYILSYGQESKTLRFNYAVEGGGPIRYQAPYAFLAIDGASGSRANGFSFMADDVTGINEMATESPSTDKYVYTIEGVKADARRLGKGLYVVKGKKLLIK